MPEIVYTHDPKDDTGGSRLWGFVFTDFDDDSIKELYDLENVFPEEKLNLITISLKNNSLLNYRQILKSNMWVEKDSFLVQDLVDYRNAKDKISVIKRHIQFIENYQDELNRHRTHFQIYCDNNKLKYSPYNFKPDDLINNYRAAKLIIEIIEIRSEILKILINELEDAKIKVGLNVNFRDVVLDKSIINNMLTCKSDEKKFTDILNSFIKKGYLLLSSEKEKDRIIEYLKIAFGYIRINQSNFTGKSFIEYKVIWIGSRYVYVWFVRRFIKQNKLSYQNSHSPTVIAKVLYNYILLKKGKDKYLTEKSYIQNFRQYKSDNAPQYMKRERGLIKSRKKK